MTLPLRRVVVTGLGVVSPVGCTTSTAWDNLLRGVTGIQRIPDELKGEGAQKLPCTTVALVDEVELKTAAQDLGFEDKWITNKRTQEPKFIAYALHAAKQCLIDARLLEDNTVDEELSCRAGVSIGSGIGSAVSEVVAAHESFQSKRGLKTVTPFFVPRLLSNEAAAHVGIENNLKGPLLANVAACASGAQAIIDAYKCIILNEAEVMVAGGTESSIDSLSLAGFARLRALSTATGTDEELTQNSRPFDAARDGFVMGEGCGLMVLEELEHALKRKAHMYVIYQFFAVTYLVNLNKSIDMRKYVALLRLLMHITSLRQLKRLNSS